MMKYFYYAWAMMLILFTGCVKEDRRGCLPTARVAIDLDWSRVSEGEPLPAGTKFYFYPADGSEAIVQDADATGFDGYLPLGNYRVLVHNTDYQGVQLSGLHSYELAEAAVSEATVQAGGAARSGVFAFSGGTKAGLPLVGQPSQFFGASLGELAVEDSLILRMTPKSYVNNITVVVKITGDFASVNACDLEITGVVAAVNLSTGELIHGRPARIQVSGVRVGDGYSSHARLFGKDESTSSMLNVGIGFVNGGNQHIGLDISAALVEVNVETTIDLEIDVEVEVQKDQEGNFTAVLTSWTHNTGNVDVN